MRRTVLFCARAIDQARTRQNDRNTRFICCWPESALTVPPFLENKLEASGTRRLACAPLDDNTMVASTQSPSIDVVPPSNASPPPPSYAGVRARGRPVAGYSGAATTTAMEEVGVVGVDAWREVDDEMEAAVKSAVARYKVLAQREAGAVVGADRDVRTVRAARRRRRHPAPPPPLLPAPPPRSPPPSAFLVLDGGQGG